MIMKNEASILPRLLESVSAIIDYYVIVDTGSTDNSKEVVKNFFDAKGIPGEIHDLPFVNFEVNRNFALEKLKGKADYGLIIDADEELYTWSKITKEELHAVLRKTDLCSLICVQGNTEWERPAFSG